MNLWILVTFLLLLSAALCALKSAGKVRLGWFWCVLPGAIPIVIAAGLGICAAILYSG
jgi:hypothetical protein